jgi:hypothetical protein
MKYFIGVLLKVSKSKMMQTVAHEMNSGMCNNSKRCSTHIKKEDLLDCP